MTSILERPRTKPKAAASFVPSLPQVNLLPPEVRAARNLKATQRWLGLSLVVVLVLCVGLFGFAKIGESTASRDLSRAQDETVQLQQEQTKYGDVPKVLTALDQIEQARAQAMTTDIQWKSYIDAITAVLPADVSIDTLTLQMSGVAAQPVPGQTATPVGVIQFTGRTKTVPDTAAWITALDSVPGFSDAAVASVTVTEDEHGVYYAVQSSVQVTTGAFSHRFDVQQKGKN